MTLNSNAKEECVTSADTITNQRRLNILPSELEQFRARLKEGLYTKVERDLILSLIDINITVGDIPEPKGLSRYDSGDS
jgi:hypothetical protein